MPTIGPCHTMIVCELENTRATKGILDPGPYEKIYPNLLLILNSTVN